jgi:predicted membrane channel-forming protein YqfA (hemolysin III family)
MKNSGSAWLWRRFIVDLLIGASMVTVAFAVIGATTDVLYMLIPCAIALVGMGLLLEPSDAAQSERHIFALGHTTS